MQNIFNFTTIGVILDDSNIYGGVNFIQEINPSPDLCYGNVASAEVKFEYDNRNDDAQNYLNYTFRWESLQNDGCGPRVMGYYTVKDITYNGKKATFTCYDCISDLDVYIDEWFSSITLPMDLGIVFSAFCNKFGFTYAKNFNFDAYQVEKTFIPQNITGRQFLGYMAQVMNCNVMANPDTDKKIDLKRYKDEYKQNFRKHMYVSRTIGDTTNRIDRIVVQSSFDDLGYRSGSGTNAYIVVENPLFFTAEHSDTHQSYVENMLTHLSGLPNYHSFKLSTFGDYGVDCGDGIYIDYDYQGWVMKKTISPSGVVFECYGEPQRQLEEEEVKSGIVMLNNKMNKFEQTLDSTTSTITRIEAEFDGEINKLNTQYSEIKQTADTISQTVANQTTQIDGLGNEIDVISNEVSTVKQTASEISQTVTNQVSRIDGEMEVLEGSISEVKQTAESIKLSVDSNGKTASITIGGQTFTVINPEGVEEEVNGINLDGYVTFTALSANGQSSIHGGNIITQTIDADDINMTGRIAWGDLTDEVQTQINSGNLPGYIKDTYIDFTQVNSPYIRGNNIELRGGTFDIKSGDGKTRYGYIGKGNGHDGTAETDGVILSYSGSTGLGTGDYYIIVTSKGVRLQAGNSSIYVTANGCFTETNGQGDVEIGTCIFG